MADNPVLVFVRELADKADQVYVATRKASVRLDHCGDEATARFIIDRLKERYLVKP